MEKNKFQCPQCGAASSMKVGTNTYHCIYCDSSFSVEPSKADMLSSLLQGTDEQRQKNAEKLAQIRASMTPEAMAAMKKKGRVIVFSVLAFVFIFLGGIFFTVTRSVTAATKSQAIENATISKFAVFSGSKGPVIWKLLEQEGGISDSVHYLLQIIDPRNNVVMKEVQFIPAMTWEDNFHADKLIGSLYPFGDTCWIISEHDILYGRDIYTGKIIVTATQLSNKYPELSKGITKAEWPYTNRVFNITTNDGFEFVFSPDAKKVYTKDNWEKRDDKNQVTKTFFVLTETKRPSLFKTVEKTSRFSTSSHTFSSQLEEYDPNKRSWNLSDDVISITPLLPDKTFFNGFVEYSDNEKAIIMYQNSVAKKSAVHICCVNAAGKELWDITGKDIEHFAKIFSENNRGVDFTYSSTALILFEEYGDHEAIGIDWNTGKVLWTQPVAGK